MTVDIFERYGLRRIVNVSGTETPYGASPVRPEVIDAIREILPRSVLMAELQSAASQVIAQAFGSEAGCVTGCTAASIAITVAACMTGRDLGRVEQLPDTTGMKSAVVMQKGHEMTYGQNVSQNVRLTGARMVEIGAATQCGSYQLRHAIGPDTAAALFVVSLHTVQHGLITLEDFCSVCREHGVPVIVDAASMPDPRPYLAAGADLVLFSAHKAFAGLTAGVIAGRRDLVQACVYQEHGIGRPMKVGKEGVTGAIAAIEAWRAEDPAVLREALDARLARAADRLGGIPGLTVSHRGRQLELQIDPMQAGISAQGLAARLLAGEPGIIVGRHLAGAGILRLTLGKVSDEAADLVCARIAAVCGTGRPDLREPSLNSADAVAEQLEHWPRALRRSAGQTQIPSNGPPEGDRR